MTRASLNQLNQCIARLDHWRQRREERRLDAKLLRRAIDLLCSYRNLIKEQENALRDDIFND